jgi:hypothetical protein
VKCLQGIVLITKLMPARFHCLNEFSFAHLHVDEIALGGKKKKKDTLVKKGEAVSS